MGTIYERAFLRLAASGASDSTEGLFKVPHETRPSPICVPFLSPDDGPHGSFYIQVAYNGTNPTCGPLVERAWVFQESELARRTVVFGKGSLSWVCRESDYTERFCEPHEWGRKWQRRPHDWTSKLDNYMY
ncbi:hypothetical protein BDV96DRAFT_590070 [Lophiotrema nucula]|uniref:Heterokaryon incompatibility domain-containing protein n=1 Tax=Lophiotrema nucula TaxID=690887 RepID=A0A6A5YLM7_9PLEO|nr:hypothetical protein BDV96DRAFT_590070 [Lophiotrema nucula]